MSAALFSGLLLLLAGAVEATPAAVGVREDAPPGVPALSAYLLARPGDPWADGAHATLPAGTPARVVFAVFIVTGGRTSLFAMADELTLAACDGEGQVDSWVYTGRRNLVLLCEDTTIAPAAPFLRRGLAERIERAILQPQ